MIATSQAIGLARVNVQRIDLAHEISCQFLFVCSFFPQVTNREISWLEIYLPKKTKTKQKTWDNIQGVQSRQGRTMIELVMNLVTFFFPQLHP